MFDGVAETAMNLYASIFTGSKVVRIDRYGNGEPGAVGTVKRGEFVLAGHTLLWVDSPVKHAFTFTPSISIFVDCQDDAEPQEAFRELSAGGQVLMPLGHYGFSKKFGWVNDRFGVSWQLNLP